MNKQRLQTLVDRQDILDCLTRFSRGIDRLDRDIFLSAFHEDATIAAGPFVGTPPALCDWSFAMHEEMQILTQHNLLNHTCEIEGDTAHTETYYMFVARNKDETIWLAGGRYVDRLERRDLPGIDRNGKGERSRADISYIRPLTNKREPSIPVG